MSINTKVLNRLGEHIKGVTSDGIEPIKVYDLEVEAHNTLWRETDPTELTLSKILPRTDALQVRHEFTQIIAHSNRRRSFPNVSDTRNPPNSRFESRRLAAYCRLMGEIMPTHLMASLEKTITVEGRDGVPDVSRAMLRKSMLERRNRALYVSDTTAHSQGGSSTRQKGLLQLIREGTDGSQLDLDGVSVPASPLGVHVFDLEGAPLTVDTIRDKVADMTVLFGNTKCILMDPRVRASMETSLDGAEHLPFPVQTQAYILGRNTAGFQTQGNVSWFHTDNTLSPEWLWGQYTGQLDEDGPSTKPTVSVAVGAVASGEDSRWNAGDAGNIYWIVTEVKDELEGLGTRFPATADTYQAVAAGQKATLTITAGDPKAHSLRIYRGTDADLGVDTKAWFIAEIANSTDGSAVTHKDLNHSRPNTSMVFGLNIDSPAARDLPRGLAMGEHYDAIVKKAGNYLNQRDNIATNTVAWAKLGPDLGVLNLANIIPTVDNPFMFSAGSLFLRNPRQNWVFTNVGR